MPLVTLYGKPGCHLCDDARAVIHSVRARRPFELREVDITVDPGLYRRYGEQIPVIAVNGVELFEHFVAPEALERSLDRVDA